MEVKVGLHVCLRGLVLSEGTWWTKTLHKMVFKRLTSLLSCVHLSSVRHCSVFLLLIIGVLSFMLAFQKNSVVIPCSGILQNLEAHNNNLCWASYRNEDSVGLVWHGLLLEDHCSSAIEMLFIAMQCFPKCMQKWPCWFGRLWVWFDCKYIRIVYLEQTKQHWYEKLTSFLSPPGCQFPRK